MGANGNKITLTKEQIDTAAKLAGIGCTLEQIAYIIGVSPATLDRLKKRDEALADALDKGRSLASSEVLKTAFKMATSGKHPWMTGFWLKCKLGWKEPKHEEMQAPEENKTLTLNYQK
jgi:DNA-binding CsgD family transcriptional regulator